MFVHVDRNERLLDVCSAQEDAEPDVSGLDKKAARQAILLWRREQALKRAQQEKADIAARSVSRSTSTSPRLRTSWSAERLTSTR